MKTDTRRRRVVQSLIRPRALFFYVSEASRQFFPKAAEQLAIILRVEQRDVHGRSVMGVRYSRSCVVVNRHERLVDSLGVSEVYECDVLVTFHSWVRDLNRDLNPVLSL